MSLVPIASQSEPAQSWQFEVQMADGEQALMGFSISESMQQSHYTCFIYTLMEKETYRQTKWVRSTPMEYQRIFVMIVEFLTKIVMHSLSGGIIASRCQALLPLAPGKSACPVQMLRWWQLDLPTDSEDCLAMVFSRCINMTILRWGHGVRHYKGLSAPWRTLWHDLHGRPWQSVSFLVIHGWSSPSAEA